MAPHDGGVGHNSTKFEAGKAVVGDWLYACAQVEPFRCRIPKSKR